MVDILVIEDNREIGELLCDFLGAEGYSTKLARTGEEGTAFFKGRGARLVLLDLMLPGIDGFSVCQDIRRASNVPVFMISAKTDKEDKLNGLLLGADDYIEKPFDIDLLTARIAGIFKRRYENQVIQCGDLCLDKKKRTVKKSGKELACTVKEYELLLFLMENAGKALTKDQLFYKVWGFESCSEPQTLTVHIKRLREKIEDDPGHPCLLTTVWGVGYRFEGER